MEISLSEVERVDVVEALQEWISEGFSHPTSDRSQRISALLDRLAPLQASS